MDIASVLLIALGLSMDALAVAISSGMVTRQMRMVCALRVAVFFGGFQALMPTLGWLAGTGLRDFISGFDHWVAFALLVMIGLRMIYEAVVKRGEERKIDPDKLLVLLVLAIATSIDALAVGLSLSFLRTVIILPVIIIGCVTFILSFIGVLIGHRVGHFFEKKIEIAGGLILIGIGIRILVSHLG